MGRKLGERNCSVGDRPRGPTRTALHTRAEATASWETTKERKAADLGTSPRSRAGQPRLGETRPPGRIPTRTTMLRVVTDFPHTRLPGTGPRDTAELTSWLPGCKARCSLQEQNLVVRHKGKRFGGRQETPVLCHSCPSPWAADAGCSHQHASP